MPEKKKTSEEQVTETAQTSKRRRRTADEILEAKAAKETKVKKSETSDQPKPQSKAKVIKSEPEIAPIEKPKFRRVKPRLSELVEKEKSEPKAKSKPKPKPVTQKEPEKAKPATVSEIPNEYGSELQLSWRSSGSRPTAERKSPQSQAKVESKVEAKARPTKREAKKRVQAIPEYEILAEPVEFGDERVKIVAFRAPSSRKSVKKTKPSRKSDKSADTLVLEAGPETSPQATLFVRKPTPRREEAAQVVLYKDDVVLIKDKKIFAPILFSASAESPAQAKQVMEETRWASDNKVGLFMLPVTLSVGDEQEVTFERIKAQIDQFLSVNAEAQFIIRLNIQPPANWEDAYPDSVFDKNFGPSFCDDAFWADAKKAVAALVAQLSESAFKANIMGIHVDRNGWYYPEGFYDTSKSADQQFRIWLKHRYRDHVVPLRASWFDGEVDFESAKVPAKPADDSKGFVRTDRRARKWIDYHLFLSDIIVERIGDLCYAIKEASEGEFLTGANYGYTFEWSYPTSGHLSLGKLLRCPELDYIAGPPSYKHRKPGESASFPFPVDSFALNGKLFISEADYRTPMGRPSDLEDTVTIMSTPQALEAAHWRDAGSALAHNGGVCWLDKEGHGWLNSKSIWERAGKIRETLLRRHVTQQQDPEVAVFVDERSLAYLVDQTAFEDLISSVREDLLRSGLSIGYYLLSDLAHREQFPDAKLYIFLNAWDIRPEVRSAIKTRLQRDNKVLYWLYTAGLFEGGRESLERVREVTGIALRPQPFASKSGTTIINTREPLVKHLDPERLSKGGRLDPSYFAIPEDSLILGEYAQTDLPSLVMRTFKGDIPEENWTTVFQGEPIVSPGFFRSLAQVAGTHVWNFDNDVVHARPPFLTIHCTGTGPRTVTLPAKWAAYNVKSDEYMSVDGNSLKFTGVDGATYNFIVGTLGDVQAIVNSSVDDLLEITEPIIRDENTLDWHSIKFDVPIMKLDEWMEESWTDEHADDLLLKPSTLDIDSESLLAEMEKPTTPGRRHNRNRRRPDESSQRRRDTSDHEFGQTGVSVLFRKRD